MTRSPALSLSPRLVPRRRPALTRAVVAVMRAEPRPAPPARRILEVTRRQWREPVADARPIRTIIVGHG